MGNDYTVTPLASTRTLLMHVPPREAAEGDPALAEIYSWDKDRSKTIDFSEIKEAATALRKSRDAARRWRVMFFALSVAAAVVVGALFGILIGANELTKPVRVDGSSDDDDSNAPVGIARVASLTDGKGNNLEVIEEEEEGPTLFDIGGMDAESLHEFKEITLPLSVDSDDEDIFAEVLKIVRRSLPPTPGDLNEPDLDVETSREVETEVVMYLSAGHKLVVRPAEATLTMFAESGSPVKIVYHRGPKDPITGRYDIVISDNPMDDLPPSGISPDGGDDSDINGTASSRFAKRPIIGAKSIGNRVMLRHLWHGSDDPDWHRANNRHWHRRGYLFDSATGEIHMMPKGLAGAWTHGNENVRRLATVHTLSSSGRPVYTYTRSAMPVVMKGAVQSSGSYKNMPELPGYPIFSSGDCKRLAKKYKWQKNRRKQKKYCKKLYKSKLKKGRAACAASTADMPKFFLIKCNSELDMNVCTKLCQTKGKGKKSEAKAEECSAKCSAQSDSIIYGRLIYADDNSVVGVSKFVPNKRWNQCQNPRDPTVFSNTIELCLPTVISPNGLRDPGANGIDLAKIFANNVTTTDVWKYYTAGECVSSCRNKIWISKRVRVMYLPNKYRIEDVGPKASPKKVAGCEEQCSVIFARRTACLAACALTSSPSSSSAIECFQSCEYETCKSAKFWIGNWERKDFYLTGDDYTKSDTYWPRKLPDYKMEWSEECEATYKNDLNTVEGYAKAFGINVHTREQLIGADYSEGKKYFGDKSCDSSPYIEVILGLNATSDDDYSEIVG